MICPCCGSTTDKANPVASVLRDVPPVSGAILHVLARDFGGFVKTPTIIDHVWGADPTGGPLMAKVCVAQAIARMRPALSKHGLQVVGRQYLGYRLGVAA